MIRNYLMVAYRNIVRYKIYSLINISGLAIGIAFCILTFLYVRHEWTYDAFHKNADRIYRVYLEGKFPGMKIGRLSSLPLPLGPALVEAYPEITRMARLTAASNATFEYRQVRVSYGEKVFEAEHLFVDRSFFEMFSFPLKWGDPELALKERHAVVLSDAVARKFFGNENPVGKRLTLRSQKRIVKDGRISYPSQDFMVTGVAEPFPENSSIRFDLLLPYENVAFFFQWDITKWSRRNTCNIYVQLSAEAQPAELEAKLAPLVKKVLFPGMDETASRLGIQPLTDLYLNPHYLNWIDHGTEPASDPNNSYTLSGIALLVLLIACINFTNLAVGRSSTRSKEVGVRKVVGALRMHLIKQFWGESILLSSIALLFGIALAELCLPAFNDLIGKNLAMDYYADRSTLAALISLALVVGLIAGSYPALVLSGFHPVSVLAGRLRIGGTNLLSRILVAVQFSLSVFLIISTVVMVGQLNFVKTRDLGFNDDLLVSIRTDELPEMLGYHPKIKNGFLQHSHILGVTVVGYALLDEIGPYVQAVKFPDGTEIGIRMHDVDYDFLKVLEIDLVDGRGFSQEFEVDKKDAIIVNETLARQMGWGSALGQSIPLRRGPRTVIGVVKDFHVQSLHHKVQPAALRLHYSAGWDWEHGNLFLVRIKPDHISATLAYMKEKWHEVVPENTFRHTFLNEEIARFYQDEERWREIVGYSSLFAIIIACLGAFGLTALAVSLRTKEVGIRKALGASVSSIVSLFVREFVLLVAVATVIAWPVAYYAMDRWLQDFAYRIELGVSTFVLAGVLMLAVVLATVSLQTVKAARANPVDALRYE